MSYYVRCKFLASKPNDDFVSCEICSRADENYATVDAWHRGAKLILECLFDAGTVPYYDLSIEVLGGAGNE